MNDAIAGSMPPPRALTSEQRERQTKPSDNRTNAPAGSHGPEYNCATSTLQRAFLTTRRNPPESERWAHPWRRVPRCGSPEVESIQRAGQIANDPASSRSRSSGARCPRDPARGPATTPAKPSCCLTTKSILPLFILFCRRPISKASGEYHDQRHIQQFASCPGVSNAAPAAELPDAEEQSERST